MKRTIGYLGPEGSYSHEVAIYAGADEQMALNELNFLTALAEKKVQMAVLPVVNSIVGQVKWVLELFANGNGEYEITREIIWNIKSNLIGFGKIEQIKTVCSHTEALGQCKNFLSKMPGVAIEEKGSTSAAVKLVAEKKDPTWAAIGTSLAAEMYGVPIIARKVNDHYNNKTLFTVLGGTKLPPTGNDKTSLLFGTANKPGALVDVLLVFKVLGINMGHIFSHPSPNKKLGEYVFLIEVDGHREDKDLSVALEKITTMVEYLKILGSYPKAT